MENLNEEEMKKKIKKYQEKGLPFIWPPVQKKIDQWKSWVEAQFSGNIMFFSYGEHMVLEVLKRLEELKNGASVNTMLKEIDDDGHTNWSYAQLRNSLVEFSKRGIEFGKSARYGFDSPEDRAVWEKHLKSVAISNKNYLKQLKEKGSEM